MGRISAQLRLNLNRRLLAWYRANRRDLPWRRSRDPYAVWVSEVILQQTQVEAALRYYGKFLRDFPTVQSLARARADKVLSRWSGLGYYKRARNLHAAAKKLMTEFDGGLPPDVRSLQSLPGVGRYTAGAIASIAFGLRTPVVDGNVERVLVRLFAYGGSLRSAEGKKWLWQTAESLLPRRAAGDWNQALMELGALVCTRAAPRCSVCPVCACCRARAAGIQESIPAARKAAREIRVDRCVAVVERAGRLLLSKRSDPTPMKDLWELLAVDGKPEQASERFAKNGIRIGQYVGVVRHTITFRKIFLHVFRGKLAAGTRLENGRWVRRGQLRNLPHSSQLTKILKLLNT